MLHLKAQAFNECVYFFLRRASGTDLTLTLNLLLSNSAENPSSTTIRL